MTVVRKCQQRRRRRRRRARNETPDARQLDSKHVNSNIEAFISSRFLRKLATISQNLTVGVLHRDGLTRWLQHTGSLYRYF